MPKHLAQRVSTRKASDVFTWKRCNKSFNNKNILIYYMYVQCFSVFEICPTIYIAGGIGFKTCIVCNKF